MSAGSEFVESTWPYDRTRLPEWYARPTPEACRQPALFAAGPDDVNDVLVALRISVDDLARWRGRGWVSFGPRPDHTIESWHVNELRFVRDVVRSGLSDAHVDAMLAELPRPMDFDPAQVAYSFSFGWVQAVPAREPDVAEFIEEYLHEWLQGLAESNPERLRTLMTDVSDAIESIAGDSNET